MPKPTPRQTGLAAAIIAVAGASGFGGSRLMAGEIRAAASPVSVEWMRSQEERIRSVNDRLTTLEQDQKNDRTERTKAEDIAMHAIDKIDAKLDRLLERIK